MNMRTKNYYLMDVKLENGRKAGFIEDLLIDFEKAVIVGFAISPLLSFKRKVCVLKEDIISVKDFMIIKKIQKCKACEFKNYKNINVFDIDNNFMGMLEDVIFDDNSYKIYSYILSGGIFRNIFSGKNLILPHYCKFNDKKIIYQISMNEINFVSLPHRIIVKGECNEKY